MPQETTAPPGLWLSQLCLPTTLMPACSPSLTTLSAWGSLISLGLIAVSAAGRAKPCALGCGCRELSGEGGLSCPSARHMSNPIWERILLSFLIWWQALLKKKKKNHQLRRFCNVYQAPLLRSDNVSCQEYIYSVSPISHLVQGNMISHGGLTYKPSGH